MKIPQQMHYYTSVNTHSFVIFYILLFSFPFSNSQASPRFQAPSQGLQTNTITLIISGSLTHGKSSNNITFHKNFQAIPSLVFGLAGLDSLDGQIALFQEATSRTFTYFTHKLSLKDMKNSIQYLKITYLAINLIKFNFVSPHSLVIQSSFLSNSDNPDSEYIQVQYLNPLNQNYDYKIGVVMSGFWINSNALTYIGVEAQLYNLSSYLVKMTVKNGTMLCVQIGRILIDKTTESLQIFTHNYKNVQIGRISHYEKFQTNFQPQKFDFYQQSKFFGITYFQKSFAFLNSQIAIPPNPTANIAITLVIFMQYLCPLFYSFYEPISMNCYSNCSIRLYQIDLTTCGRCSGACYRCTGPLMRDCVKYLPQQADNITTDILCKIDYATDHLTRRCKSCQSNEFGCIKCYQNGSCAQCRTGCTLQSQFICDCAPVCINAYKILSPITGACICKPQYYQISNGSCLPCQRGCYLCQISASNCSVCIDRYQLYQSTCILFQHSRYIIDQSNGYIQESSRCFQKIQNTCKASCDNNFFLYKFQCFTRVCPDKTFGFTDIYSGGLCQPCSQNCIDCDIYFVCKLCNNDGYYLNGTGQCELCMPGCKSCNHPISCQQCKSGYIMDNTNTTCIEVLPTNASYCGLGCRKCLIDQYCQECQTGFTRIRDSYACTKCQGIGFIPNYTNLIIQSGNVIEYTCKQFCGDGLLLMDQCDDENNIGGDGCSQNCIIQEGYICQYLSTKKKSFCILPDYSIQTTITKNLTSNQINITVFWNGGSSVLLQYNCPSFMKLQYYTLMNSSCVYTFSFSKSVENYICTFTLSQSTILQPIICNISTSPCALYYRADHFFFQYSALVLSYITKPLAYMTWIFCVLAIDPLSMLINHTFLYLYLATLYQFNAQPPNVYGIFSSLKFFAFDEITISTTEAIKKDGMNFLQPTYRLLILFGICVGYQEVVVRFLKNNVIFADCQSKIFQNIFRNRLTSYICIFNSFQPILAVYLTAIILKISEMQINKNISGFIVASIHLLCSAITLILLFVNFHYMTTNKYNLKYLYFVCVVKSISVFGLLFSCLSFGLEFISAVVIAISLFIFLILVFFDCSTEQIFLNRKYDDEELSITARTTTQQTSNMWIQSKSMIRKINSFIQVSGFILICILRIFYMQNFNMTQNIQSYGIIINVIFLGSLFSGFLLHILQIILSLGIFLSGELELDPNDPQDNNQSNKDSSRKKRREEISISQLSRIDLKP